MSRAKTTSRPEPPAQATPGPLRAYLACFFFDEFGDLDREGEFQIVVQARDAEQAMERCRTLLRKLRAETTLFERPCSLYCKGLLELPDSFEGGVLVNFTSSRIEGTRSSIACLVPEQEDETITTYEWTPDARGEASESDQEDASLEPFLDFGGQGVVAERKALHEAHAPRALAMQTPRPARDHLPKAAEPTEKKTEKAARARQKALARTLAEVGGSHHRPRRPPTK